MPYKIGPNGEKTPLSAEELDALYEKCEKGARRIATQRVTDTENLLAEVAIVNRAWKERLDFLAQKKDLEKSGREVKNVLLEIDVRNTMMFSAFQDLNVFSEWVRVISQDETQVVRAYGFAVRLAERLEVARWATQREKETILNDLDDKKRPNRQFVIYRGEFKVPVSSENDLHKRVFYQLECLRRAARAAMEKEKGGPAHSVALLNFT